jgi:nitrile hydratase
VLGTEGVHPLADDRARGISGPARPVYTVQFDAGQLFGSADHAVVLALWEDYVSPVEEEV